MDGMAVFDRYADEYDRWFDENKPLYRAEVNTLRRLIPETGLGVEIGIGTGRFATPFGIRIGIEPSINMARIAARRNIAVCLEVGERLPFRDGQFDFALLVTVICFVKDATQLLREIRRVVRVGGSVILGFIDKESTLGRLYESRKATDKFYKEAHFFSPPEIASLLSRVGFGNLKFYQTILGLPGRGTATCRVRTGYGEGAFVAVRARKFKEEVPHENPVHS